MNNRDGPATVSCAEGVRCSSPARQRGAPPSFHASRSHLGQCRKLARLNGMSVLPSTADVIGSLRHVRFVPNSDLGNEAADRAHSINPAGASLRWSTSPQSLPAHTAYPSDPVAECHSCLFISRKNGGFDSFGRGIGMAGIKWRVRIVLDA